MQGITGIGRQNSVLGASNSRDEHGVAALQNGGYVLTWGVSSDGTKAQIFGSDGRPETEIFDVSLSPNDENRPDVTTLADGSFVVAYTSLGSARATINAQRFSEDGIRIGDEFVVYGSTLHSSTDPEITALTDGGYVVAYNGLGRDISLFSYHARAFDADGTPRGSDFLVNQTTDRSQSFGDVISLADGGFAVTWRSEGVDGSSHSVMLRLYDPDGTPRTGEMQMNQYWEGSQLSPAIAVLKNGNILLTWASGPTLFTEPQDGSGAGVYARIIEPDGTPVGDEFQVHTQTLDHQDQPEVVALADGGFVIVWVHTSSSDFTSIMGQRFSAEGEPMGAETSLSPVTQEYHFSPDVIELSDGVISVSWRDFDIGERWGQIETRLFLTPDLGSEGNDVLSGTHYRDRLEALRGDDRLLGYAGNDRLIGGLGEDTLKGHSGSDRLIGGHHKDKIFGGNDADFLSGGKGRDILNGEAGDDVLKGGAGADVFVFGDGQDTIVDFGNDLIRLDNALWQNEDLTPNEIMQFAEIENGSLIFDFGSGNTLTLTGYTDLNTLESALSVF